MGGGNCLTRPSPITQPITHMSSPLTTPRDLRPGPPALRTSYPKDSFSDAWLLMPRKGWTGVRRAEGRGPAEKTSQDQFKQPGQDRNQGKPGRGGSCLHRPPNWHSNSSRRLRLPLPISADPQPHQPGKCNAGVSAIGRDTPLDKTVSMPSTTANREVRRSKGRLLFFRCFSLRC